MVLAYFAASCLALTVHSAPRAAPAVSDRPTIVQPRLPASTTQLSRIAFGSCLREDQPAPIMHQVADDAPDVFIFLGDNIYGDTEDMNDLRRDYATMIAQPAVQRVLSRTPILATWDDHDYGKNDAGLEYPKRAESLQVFCDVWGMPADSPRRKHEGIYDAMTFGPVERSVQVILLDTRYNRSPMAKGERNTEDPFGYPGSYGIESSDNATVLGEAQWSWLEAQLRQPAKVRIIASSIQFVSEEHRYENWGNFPRERSRLIELLNKTGAGGVIFLSGDRHTAEISRLMPGAVGTTSPTRNNPYPTAAPISQQPQYPIYDITASPINQTRKQRNERNRHLIGSRYAEANYGLIEIDWSKPDPIISMQIKDAGGMAVLREDVALSTLKP